MAFDHWISAHMAATLLGVTPEAVSKMYREGRVKRRWEPDAGKPYAPVYYSWAEICRLKETSSRVRRRKKLPRKEESEPPEPVWMTTQEAAGFWRLISHESGYSSSAGDFSVVAKAVISDVSGPTF